MAKNTLLQDEHSVCDRGAMTPLMDLTAPRLEAAANEASSLAKSSIASADIFVLVENFGISYSKELIAPFLEDVGNALEKGDGLDCLDKDDKFHNMELSDSVVEPLPVTGTVAEPKLPLKNYLLSLQLQALLDTSVNALKDDTSGQNAQKVLLNVLTQTLQLAAMRAEATDAETQAVMLDVMERSAQFVEANVAVPQFNSREATGVRTLVFNVYHRLAKVLGRNTPEAVKADTKVMISMVAERIDHTPGFGRASKVSPQEHITNVVMPFLDNDGKEFAHDMSVYHSPEKPSLMKFYRLLATRHSRSKHSAVR